MGIEKKGYLIDDDVHMTPPVELSEDEKLLFKKEGTPYNLYQPYRDVKQVLAITNKRVIVRPKQGETLPDEELWEKNSSEVSPDEELWEKNSFEVYHYQIEKMFYNKKGGEGNKASRIEIKRGAEGNKTLRIEISDGSVKSLPKAPAKREAMKYISDLANLKKVKAEGESGIARKAVKKFGGRVLTLFGIGVIIVGILIAFTIILIPITIILLIIGVGIITARVKGATSEKKWIKKESSETKDGKGEDLKSEKEDSSKVREQTPTNPPQEKSQQSKEPYGKPCPECDRPMQYVEEYERWYCDSCQEYK